MEPERCPSCGKQTFIEGNISSEREGFYGRSFVPLDTRIIFRAQHGVGFRDVFKACASCGHLWNAVDPGKLRDFIRENGDELARQHLEELEHGVGFGLPDTDLAREVAGKVSEIDALVRRGKPHAGRYRELRGVKWDQAIDETKNWRSLKREEKLALFGWEPKKKEPRDEFF